MLYHNDDKIGYQMDISYVPQLHDFPWVAIRPANGAFFGHLQCFDDAGPAKDVSALCRAPALDIVIANPAQILLFLQLAVRAWLDLSGRRLWLFAAGLPGLEEAVYIFACLEEEGGEEQVSFDGVADVSDLVILVSINISNAQEGLNESEMLVPVQHIHHQDEPLHIAHYLLGASQVTTHSVSHSLTHLPDFLPQLGPALFIPTLRVFLIKDAATGTHELCKKR